MGGDDLAGLDRREIGGRRLLDALAGLELDGVCVEPAPPCRAVDHDAYSSSLHDWIQYSIPGSWSRRSVWWRNRRGVSAGSRGLPSWATSPEATRSSSEWAARWATGWSTGCSARCTPGR